MMSQLKLELHMRLIAYDSLQTYSLISYRLEIYTITWREYERIGQTNCLEYVALALKTTVPLATAHLEIFHCTHHPVIPKFDLYFTFCSTLNALSKRTSK